MVQLVGILNVTPDSFSDGGQFFDPQIAIAQTDKLFADGAAIVDVGAESTRPNAQALSDEQEWERLAPVLNDLIPRYPGKISLDSYHPATIEKALDIGEVIVNDVTGMHNPKMVELVLRRKPRVIISHLPGTDIQLAHQVSFINDRRVVKHDLLTAVRTLIEGGLSEESIILDPGIGFGKTMELNQELLSFASDVPQFPVMIGYSRKRFLGEDRMELAPNIEAAKVAIAHGAAYLRVHDVAGHVEELGLGA